MGLVNLKLHSMDGKVKGNQSLSTPYSHTGVEAPLILHFQINPLTPNDPYMSRTAPLTSKRCILYIYSTNVGYEYFKHAIYSPFFFLFKMQFVS